MGVNITNDGRKRALLLHYAGECVHDIYDAKKSSYAADTASTYEGTKIILNKYFTPKINVQMEVFNFRKCHQRDEQSLDEYATELRQLARNCNFNDVDGEMLSQIIQHCHSNRLRRRALRENDKSLADILTLGRSLELSDRQAHKIESEQSHDVHRVFEKRGNKTQLTEQNWQRHSQKPTNAKTREKSQHKSQHLHKKPNARNDKCGYCGGHYPHADTCPAKGKLCNFCHKRNHFATVCRQRKSTPINEVKTSASRSMHDNSSESSNDEYCYGIDGKKTKTPFTVAKLDDVECRLMIDTGASVNILDENTFSQIGKPKLNKRDPIQLMPYGGGKPLTVMGRCAVVVETKRNIQCHEFHVVRGDNGTLLSCATATELGLIEVTNKVTDTSIFASHPNLFSGIGKLKNVKVELHIDESVKPVALKQRRTPFHLSEKVEAEIEHLLQKDIIEKVEGVPTPWVSPIVVTPKKNTDKIRVCVDMREPNKAIMRDRHQMPTVDELINDLNGAKIFSKVDLRSGYHQLELDKNSRSITTFSTHVGLFRYKRLKFGVCSASEVFQKEIRTIVSDLEGVTNIADDILIYGSTQEKHDVALEALFRRLKDNGLTLNKQKCEFNRDKI